MTPDCRVVEGWERERGAISTRICRWSSSCLCLSLLACQPAPGGLATEVEGVWERREVTRTQAGEVTTDTQPGPSLYIFTESHYSIVGMRAGEADARYATPWTPTDEEKLARYGAVSVNAGTYEIGDGSLVVRPVVARVADFVGGEARFEYQISGDTLWLTMVEEHSRDGVTATWVGTRSSRSKLVRIE